MNRKEIWDFAEKHKISERRVYRRFLKLSPKDFAVIKSYLLESKHPLNHYEVNYRSKDLWFHLHGTKEGENYEIHNDLANPSYYAVIMVPIHTILEGIPYLIGKLYTMLFARDQLSINEKSWLKGVLEKNFGKH